MSRNPFQSYTQIQAERVSNARKIVMLLQQVAKEIDKAHDACVRQDFEARFQHTERACTILTGLRDSLNDDVQGAASLAETLNNYYSVMIIACNQINFKNDASRAKTIAQQIRDMAQTWSLLDQQETATHATPPVNDHPATTPMGRIDV